MALEMQVEPLLLGEEGNLIWMWDGRGGVSPIGNAAFFPKVGRKGLGSHPSYFLHLRT